MNQKGQKQLVENHEKVMKMLKFFGKIYHTYFGFDLVNEINVSTYRKTEGKEEEQKQEQEEEKKEEVTVEDETAEQEAAEQEAAEQEEEGEEEEEEENEDVKNEEIAFWNQYANKIDTLKDETWFYLDCKLIKEEAIKTGTPYSVVKLKLPDNYWRQQSSEWYNSPSKWWTRSTSNNVHLEYLRARGYITVIKPFYEIEIRKDMKGTLITVEDILFAARGLAADDTRMVADDKFTVLKYENDVLELRPYTDNWSS
jgi:hypothetical protein